MVSALIGYGALNAILYCSLLPLWEGFDEAFHYGYVETLSFEHTLPVFHRTGLSAEIWESLKLVPASHVVRQNLPELMAFSDYFKLSPAQRAELRARLEALPHQPRAASAHGNYEAHQAPLAYALLAIPNRAWADTPLPLRIWRLRLVCALIASVATSLLTLGIGQQLGIPAHLRHAALFLVLSSQMFYAATAHVCNDWLSIPLASLVFYSAIAAYERPGLARLALLGASLSLGLLSKSYFLGLVPLGFGLVLLLAIKRRLSLGSALLFVGALAASAPWYLRNLLLYGSLGGMQESIGGIGPGRALRASLDVPWVSALANTARATVWTGNNSFTTFSRMTVSAMLILMLVAGLFYLRGAANKLATRREALVVAGCLLFAAGLGYFTAVIFVSTKGAGIGTPAWYVEAIVPPLVCLLACGLGRSGWAGRALTAAMLCLWAYVMAATYVAKLIPLYAGYGEGRAHIGSLLRWYVEDCWLIDDRLTTLCLVNPAFIYALAAAVLALAALLCVRLVRDVMGGQFCGLRN